MATIVKTPAGTWKAVIRKQGWPTAVKTFRTKRDAEDWARQTEDEMVRGVHIQRAPAQKLTVAAALDRYLREITPSKKAGGSQRRDHTSAKPLREGLGRYALGALTPEVIAKYRDERLAEGLSGSTVRLELALLSHLHTVALREWGISLVANPVLTVRKPKTVARDRRLHAGEEVRLLQSVRQHSNPILAWVTELALETAAREMEILSLCLQDVDMSRRIAILRDTKNGDSRTIPLSRRAAEILREAIETYPREGTNLIFPGEPGRDGKRRPYTIGKVWQQAVQRAGLDGLRFHDLRHEAASRLVEMGLSDAKVRQITGHKSAQMLYRYAHLRGEDLVADLDAAQMRRSPM
ncbi:tyrosine-type recombinase/integrase [Acidithiobacillus sulfuriphilus]|uniref:Site-specific integrase n=2 Tax=Acidithiobacillus sulfuriphilus TaxID=1867749 RepID=A0A3M8R5C1_9PROT|nr:site-specific integrase [Acidithiobacillus sulfuriphilus]RNF63768.1 site-specific integrase [Acidithiobacillus sulfuriphilus]